MLRCTAYWQANTAKKALNNMVTIYFSGTGNSEHIGKHFSKKMGCECYSIEEDVDFKTLFFKNDTISFCYPVYGSNVPYIMRKFVEKYKSNLHGKKIIIFCTQLMFSGDGARVFTDFLEGIDFTVIYAEHFNMPNNICNLFFLPVASERRVEKRFNKAKKKMDKSCENIKRGIIRKRGFNVFSKYLGFLSQRFYFQASEKRAMEDVRINVDCILCGECIKICPMGNLTRVEDGIKQNKNCTLCYRCVNICPRKAITVFVHSRVKKQYNYFIR